MIFTVRTFELCVDQVASRLCLLLLHNKTILLLLQQQNNMQAANLFYVAPQLNKIMCKTSVDNCASILMQFPVSNIAS